METRSSIRWVVYAELKRVELGILRIVRDVFTAIMIEGFLPKFAFSQRGEVRFAVERGFPPPQFSTALTHNRFAGRD